MITQEEYKPVTSETLPITFHEITNAPHDPETNNLIKWQPNKNNQSITGYMETKRISIYNHPQNKHIQIGYIINSPDGNKYLVEASYHGDLERKLNSINIGELIKIQLEKVPVGVEYYGEDGYWYNYHVYKAGRGRINMEDIPPVYVTDKVWKKALSEDININTFLETKLIEELKARGINIDTEK